MIEVLLTSSVLILALALLRFFGNRVSARLRYALWALVLVRLLLPAGLIQSPVSVMNAAPTLEMRATRVGPDAPIGPSVSEPEPAVSVPAASESVGGGLPDAPPGDSLPPLSKGGEPSQAAGGSPSPLNWRAVLGWVWLAGACAVGGYFLLSNLLFYRRLRLSAERCPDIEYALPVYRANFLPSPCMAGLLRPAIYLNAAALESGEGLRHVLAHETCHKRHGDNWWALLRCLCLAVWWFHPLVWLAAYLSRRDCELACDESALKLLGETERIPYGKTLVGLTARPAPADLLRCSTAMTASGKALKERIAYISTGRKTWVATVLTVLLGLTLAACTLTGQVSGPATLPSPLPQPDEGPAMTESARRGNFFTFLIVGKDTHGGGNTDTMILAAYDVTNQKLNFMSLPRDTLVNVSWDIKKLNSVYNMYGGEKKGLDALREEIGQLVGFVPDFTVTVEWEAVGALVDAIGGVEFDVPRRMYYNDLSQNFIIDLQPGEQTLSGAQAMQLLRYRHDSDDSGHILNTGYPDGDLGRIKVQQDFLKAAVSRCMEKITDAGTVMKLAQVFIENVTTDLTVGNLVWLGKAAIFGEGGSSRLDMESISFITMPWVNADGVKSRTYNNYPSYVAPDVDKAMAVINEYFNPYKTDLDKHELDIMYVNKDGTLGTTGGELEDTEYNRWVTAD